MTDRDTINCRDIIRELGDYVDNEMDAERKSVMTHHIASCEQCREFERTYRFTIELASELRPTEVEMSLGAKNRLRKALNERLGLSLALLGDA